MRTAKNYNENGGDTTVIGGILDIKENAIVKVAGEEVDIVNKVAVSQSDSTASDITGVVTDLNTLIGKLKTAGIMASE